MFSRILIGLIVLASVEEPLAQDTLYFRGFKGREHFVLTSQSITVRLTDTLSTIDAIAGSYPELVISDKPDRIGPYVFVLQVQDSVKMDSLLDRMNGDERVEFAIRCAYSQGGSEVYLDNSIWILLHSASTRRTTENALEKLHLTIKPMTQDHPEIIASALQRTDLHRYGEILDAIAEVDGVRCYVPVFWNRISLLSAPNDPWWSEQEQLWADKLNLEHAFDFSLSTDSVSIHFFDDGVATHEDFPQPFSITGKNWVHNTPGFEVYPTSKHGMGTTGVAYAKINNALGISGYNNANFKVRVQQILLTHQTIPNISYLATVGAIWLAMIDAATKGADIINHSWGFDCGYDDPAGYIEWGLDSVYSLGALTVAGAGNCLDSSLPDPCACVILPARGPHTLAVGGLHTVSNCRDVEASFGPELDITTYSRSIPTLSLMGYQTSSLGQTSLEVNCDLLPINYRCMTGTSISSPQSAAIAGLVLAKRPDFKNKPDTLAKILRYSTDDGASPCALDTFRHDDEIGYGRVDAYRALHSVSRGNVNNVGIIDLSDLTALSNYLTIGQPIPKPDLYIGDVNCDCLVNLSDLSALVAYMTQGMPIPLCFRFPN